MRVSRYCKESWRDFLRRSLVERALLGVELAAFMEPAEEDEEDR